LLARAEADLLVRSDDALRHARESVACFRGSAARYEVGRATYAAGLAMSAVGWKEKATPLPGHVEGADRKIQFTFGYQRYTNIPNLEAHSWGPWSVGAAGSISSGFANAIWGQYAQSLSNGIAAGDYNNYPGIFATVDSNPFISPAMGVNADGRLETFVMDSGGNIEHDFQLHVYKLHPSGVGGWSNWSGIGGNLASAPTVICNGGNNPEVFALNYVGNVVHASVPWTGWANLGGTLASVPAAADNPGNRMEPNLIGLSGSGWDIWQTSVGGGWSGWSGMSHTRAGAHLPLPPGSSRMPARSPWPDHR
jgi:hypothetical protein